MKRNRDGDAKAEPSSSIFFADIFAFFTLRELCVWCARVCTYWRNLVYADPRWRVIDTKKLQIGTDEKLQCLARRKLCGVKELYVTANLSGNKGKRVRGEFSSPAPSSLPLLVSQCPDLRLLYLLKLPPPFNRIFLTIFIHLRKVSVHDFIRTTAICTKSLSSLHFPFFHEIYVNDVIKILSSFHSLQHLYFDDFLPVNIVVFLIQSFKDNQLLSFKATYPTLDKQTITNFLQKFRTLQQLTIYTASGLDDDVIMNLGPSLRALNITESCYALTDVSLFHISQTCTNLEKLAIGGITWAEDLKQHKMDKVTDEGLAALSKLPKLKILKMRDCSFSPEGIQCFMKERRDSLQRLDLHQFPSIIDSILIQTAKNALYLEEITLSSLVNISFGGFEIAAHFLPKLRKVSFLWCPGFIDPHDPKEMQWGQKIEYMHFDSCEKLSDLSLMRTAAMCGSALRTFKIECSNQVTDAALIYFSKFTVKLRKFCASENHALTDTSYAQLVANCKNTLETIQLQETHAGTLTHDALSTHGKKMCNKVILNTGQLYF